MKRTPLSLLRFTLRTVPAAAAGLLCLAPALHAADRFWIGTAGGAFGSTGNWSATDGGSGGASVPGAADVANFTLNNTYTVTFSAGAANLALDVENGNVTFDPSGFTYTVSSSGAVDIGAVAGQTGRLTVRNGILATDTTGDDVNVGGVAASVGFLTITTGGRLGNGTIRPELIAGSGGTGTVTVNDNGRIDAQAVSLGTQSGSAGTLTITGPNAVVDLSSFSIIGISGTGTLSMTNGGTLTTAASVFLGENLGADGAATVSGAGSLWAMTASSTIGNNGDGTLTISSGGLVSSLSSITLGSAATGFGTATVTGAGSQWNLSGGQSIGLNGLGVMTVSSGGQVVSTGSTTIASNPGSEGRVTVTGAGARWTLGTGLVVAREGEAELTVSAGGEVATTQVELANGGRGLGVATATITGAGSKLTTSGAVNVANAGSGTLTISSGAEGSVGTNVNVTDPILAPPGTLILDGGSLYVAGNFTNGGVFNFTDGLLQVAGNFQPRPTTGELTINGNYHGDLPTLELIGAGTTTNITGITVGYDRRGQLLLRQGRVLNIGNNTLALGTSTGGEGTVSVESGAQFLTTGILEVGGTPGGIAAGAGTLNIAGGTVDVGTLELFRDGAVNLSSGTLAVDTAPVLDGQFNWTGGTLRFDAGFALTASNAPKLLGPGATLHTGQVFDSTSVLTLQTPVVVAGGSLNVTTTLINQSRLELRSGILGKLQNDGLLLGDGVITGTVTNGTAGRIRVDAGDTLSFTGTLGPNAGQLSLQGGTIEYAANLTNSVTGFINGRGTLFTGSLTNNGQMAFSGGTTDLFGDAILNAGSRVATSGAGSVTTFWDDVLHNGTEIFTGAGCSTVFFGNQVGTGPYTGSGTIYFIGDLRPGNSPAAINLAPQVVFNFSNVLTLELGGLTAGTQHDKLNFTHAATPQVEWGGTLAVTLINGFVPAAGNSFDVLDFDAARDAGTFSTITLPTLPAGLTWNTTELYTTGTLRVVSTTGLTYAQWATASGFPGASPTGRRIRVRPLPQPARHRRAHH